MINKAYRFTELRLRGSNVKDAFVNFKKGLNVIQGPSDTGKTYIYQCINYLLGASDAPKDIDEAKLYTEVFLELVTKSNKTFTIQSDLKGGDLKVFQSSIEELTFDHEFELLSRKHDPNSEETISAFFLKLNNVYGSKVRTNAQGKTRQVSYRDFVKFSMIDEIRMFTDKSIVYDNYMKKTEGANILKYIATGLDDSSIITKLSNKEITNKRGKLEMLNELIKDLEGDILKLQNNPSDNLEEIIDQINSLTESHEKLHQNYVSLNSRRKEVIAQYDNKNTEKKVLEELLERSTILDLHYNSDIKRLNSTIEASYLLRDDPIAKSECPLCKSEIEHQCDEVEITTIIDSCSAEIKKIVKLKLELQSTLKLLHREIKSLNKDVDSLSKDIESLTVNLDNNIGIEISKLAEAIGILNNKKSHFLGINIKQSQLEKYIAQRKSIKKIISQANTKGNYDSLSTAYMTSISNQVEEILKALKYPNLSAVSYSEENFDIVISGKDRRVSGKGYRAILYATFIVALHELVGDSEYSIGIPILDSPLVTYKETDKDSDGISTDLAMNFYRYLATTSKIDQIIIIENDPPPSDIENEIHFIKFTKLDNVGRYGFIETNPTVNTA